jgi:hypothetical protein
MKPILSLIAALAALCAPFTSLHATPARMQPGMWEIAVNSAAGPSISSRQCITQKQIEDSGGLPPESQKENPCKRTSLKVDGAKVTWTVACTGQYPATGIGEMTSSANQYSGKQSVSMNVNGQKLDMVATFTGKRVGDCK